MNTVDLEFLRIGLLIRFHDGERSLRPWAALLKKTGWSGPIYLEHAREDGTPRTMDFL